MTPLKIAGFLVLVMCVVSMAHYIDDVRTDYKPYEEAWAAFKIKFGRSYSESEESQRYETFVKRVKWIEAHNIDYLDKKVSFPMGISEFTDRMESDIVHSCHKDEDEELVTLRHKRQTGFCRPFSPPTGYTPPKSFDWREKGAITPVRHQGRCGSCYAFGATTTIAAQLKKKTGKLIPLSEQQLVDCSKENGCNGSNAENSFSYINRVGGIVPSADYPYTSRTSGQPGSCKLEKLKDKVVAKVSGCLYSSNSESNLKYMVAYKGPVYVSVYVIDSFHGYRARSEADVYSDANCTKKKSNGTHCLTVIGYGKDYWIVQNSWGTRWGKDGYGFIVRGKNMCGIGNKITVPEDDDSDTASSKAFAFGPPSFLVFLVLRFVVG